MIDSPLGNILLEADFKGITIAQFSWLENVPTESTNTILNQCAQEFHEYFEDKRMFFTVPLSLHGTDFQTRVWEELQNIPYGTTTTYLKMARKLGDEKVIRAAASANGKNPIAIIVPCHRVIGTNGDLVGYAGGLDKKKWLLEHEGALNRDQLGLF
ncbi:Methylated-DNA--protein-cysteine methyltransferase [hydrothermal vent metagenome]|uniref:methylated-DNA--[protein]-cysteine S-methyltransferase n=1 Tax=hydrothermal vent metagenome TaxID=652676 RepID=A0A3B0U676_9ZZZZ